MKPLLVFLFTLPFLSFSQDLPTRLEVHMFNNERVVVSLDGKQFDTCSKFKLSGLSAGDHQLKVYKPKRYINPINNSISERLVPIYSGNIYLVTDQKTTCIINEYHQKEIQIKD
tara:strand:- start:165 stop:506 length:342 start_codon:yes stop_codon:yes gene_type:complete